MPKIKPEPEEDKFFGNSRVPIRKRRTQAEIQDDIDRYNELISFHPGLERDIPPKRTIVKVKPEPEEEQEEPSLATKGTGQPSKRGRKRMVKSDTKRYLNDRKPALKRPGYQPQRTVKSTKPNHSKLRNERNETRPILLSEYTGKTFEDQVVLQNNYSNLIELLKDQTNSENNSIDISLHHNFVAKNLAYEIGRFDVDETYYDPQSNLMSSNMLCRTDIDQFFHQLGSSGSDFGAGEKMKRDIPLA